MASQVRPRLAQPDILTATSTVRLTDQASTSIFHQGPRLRVALKGRMYGCNLFLRTKTEKKTLGTVGASMYETLLHHPLSLAESREKPGFAKVRTRIRRWI
jgi:hypothetical protein